MPQKNMMPVNSEMPMEPISQDEIDMNIRYFNDPDLWVPNFEPPDYFYWYDSDADIETRVWREGIIAPYESYPRHELDHI